MRKILLGSTIALLFCAELPAPAVAASVGNPVWLAPMASEAPVLTEARMVRRSVVRGPGGGVRRTTVVRRGPYGGGGRWVRPGYRWRPGAAVAAGAALGFVAAASAAAWAGPPPARGMCWYYTDSTRRAGFWDYCP